MAKQDALHRYEGKRDFRKTSEPSGKGGRKSGGKPTFVIQQHDATSKHWDFRLDVDGVLESWAVPKGPSTDPREKRLAMPTEPHPPDYGDFEGVIPEGEYGAGPVIVWDRGTYRNLRAEKDGDGASMEDALEDGKIEVWLEGEKLTGGYALIRTGGGKKSDRERWLLIKEKDDEADARRNPVSTEPESVKSGLTVQQMADRGGDDE